MNITELGGATQFNVDVTFKGKVVAGDTVVITGSNNESKSIILTADDIKAGKVSALFTKPADGGTPLTVTAIIKDQNGNDSLADSDSAALDITAPDKNTLVELDPASDLGEKGDLITSDDTPDLLITAELGATVKVTLLGNDYSANAKLNADGKYVVPVTDSLKPGLYIPQVTVTDKAGNVSSFPGAQFVVTNVIVNDDNNLRVQVDGGKINGPLSSLTTKILGNDSDVYYDQIVSPQSNQYLSPEKNLTVQSMSYLGNAITIGADFRTNYGIANIKSDGTFTYRVDANLAATLSATKPEYESFVYSAVDKYGLVSKNTATIKVAVYGDANPSALSLVTLQGGILGSNQISILSGPGGYGPGQSNIVVNDTDVSQSFLDPAFISPSALKTHSGDFAITLLGSSNNGAQHSYKWDYTQSLENTTGTTVHDLLTVNSLDGNAYQTLEVVVAKSGELATNKIQDFYSATARGLTASGSSSTDIKDTLFLTADGLMLDLTAATSVVTGMEVLNISGQSNNSTNTLRITLANLTSMHSNQHKLYIIGDSGDAVNLVGATNEWKDLGTVTESNITYHKYGSGISGADELLIQTTNQISFSAT
ncbi:hypothetical protein C5F52_08435 [Limnohabitans sp. TS-CS-82]|nr:hypothetical protein C5F52_08435 [Limnohabitans sp. TS-CS-82]